MEDFWVWFVFGIWMLPIIAVVVVKLFFLVVMAMVAMNGLPSRSRSLTVRVRDYDYDEDGR